MFLNPILSLKEYKEFYASGKCSEIRRGSKKVKERYVHNQFLKGERILTFITPYMPSVIDGVLEIGSTSGGILAFFRDKGFEPVQGIDPEKEYVKYANEVLEVDTMEGLLEEFKSDRKFSIIIMHHILEHIVNPINALNYVSKLLAPDGIVYLEVPNLYSISSRTGKSWFHDFIPEHLYIFTPRVIERIVKIIGLDVLHNHPKNNYRNHISLVLGHSNSSKVNLPKPDNWFYLFIRGWLYNLFMPFRRFYFSFRMKVKL
jgi:SAM-dependent methyltransferase